MGSGEKEFYSTIHALSSFAGEFTELIESDFAAANGTAYSPPEEGEFRRIDVVRTIQLQKNACLSYKTSHTNTGTKLRLPCGLISTNDALNGRPFVIWNGGTSSLIVENHAGTTLATIKVGQRFILFHTENNNWLALFVAKDVVFDNSVNGFLSNDLQTATEEVDIRSITTQATTNGTLQLTVTSTYQQVFTGTTAGQIVKMPDATTLKLGTTFFLWNDSTQTISIRDYGSTVLQILPISFSGIIVLNSKGTSNGVWSISRASPGGGGGGVTPPFIFSKSGGTAVGAYLYVGQVVSSKTGQSIAGTNYLVKVSASNDAVVASNTTIQFRQRTAVATFVDIAGASVVIPAGQYNVSSILPTPINIGPDWEIACYNKSGSSLGNPIVLMYLTPA